MSAIYIEYWMIDKERKMYASCVWEKVKEKQKKKYDVGKQYIFIHQEQFYGKKSWQSGKSLRAKRQEDSYHSISLGQNEAHADATTQYTCTR